MRKRSYTFVLLVLVSCASWAAESINPVITPALFRYNDEVTVVYDVTNTPLANLPNAWAWVWIPGTSIDAKYNINPASNNTSLTNNAKFTKSVVSGKTLFTLTFVPSDFFATDISSQTKMGILLKGNDWSNGQTTDYIADFWDGSFQIKLTSPTQRPLFVSTGDNISVEAETPVTANFDFFVNDVLIEEQDNVTTFSYNHMVTETTGYATIKLVAESGGNTEEEIFQYIISASSPAVTRPAGIIPGINYQNGDATKATLCLWAPGKSSVYVLGDFSDWDVLPSNIMNKDGEYFWLEITGLASGTEYGFQYLIDESVYVGDPYADKILDPDDQYIPSAVYPGLKPYPQKALSSNWYFNRISVLQTGQADYTWQVTNFEKPVKENLVVYELLIRDFFASGDRSYDNLIDTISYFKRLGVNAIELMPIMEFNGNESWGYNPTFMFAPDKYYGPKNKLKAFIDACHKEGIAVIFDIAMNHQDIPNAYVMMDFDFTTMKPTANNKWFNVDARHPYSVFYDMNHESPYTQAYLDTINYYWLHEFKVDGYRFDLSKGFTQKMNTDVGAWSAYDASRVNILKRMADKIWEHAPDTYIILEHFAANEEEKELVEYRAGEGKGMMVWGNLNYAYNQNTMGYTDGSDISWVYHGTRGWTVPHVVGYMESHDEERNMYRNITYGNASGGYTVKDVNTAINRVKAAETIFYTIPGPKMLWQFGELGYDQSINRCEDGSINENCRISPKPVKWEYLDNVNRHKLYEHTADLIRLRNTYNVFTNGEATLSAGTSLNKQLTLKNNPYTSTPADASQMNVEVVVNFNLTQQSVIVEFPHTGTWFDYYSFGAPYEVTATSMVVSLDAGEYKLFTDVQIENPLVTGT
ncbi:MAG TPA: alpha-amylase family glycosyl hydrolase, partial [Cyclobacteriaceae bacterium]|nr:alpha-amylase family glycosyl hydrolase [Cyclobacteriaceae bacterium]